MKIDYPVMYPNLHKNQVKAIIKHCMKYQIDPVICAYYTGWDDFCSDWCDDIGYSQEEAYDKLNDKDTGEFIIFEGWGILRFSL